MDDIGGTVVNYHLGFMKINLFDFEPTSFFKDTTILKIMYLFRITY